MRSERRKRWGLKSPWPPTESAPFENASGEEQQEAAAPFQQTQKVRFNDRTVPSYPWSTDPGWEFPIRPVMHAVPSVRRNPEPFFPTRRDVVTNPGDGEGGVKTTAGDDIQEGVAPVQPLGKWQSRGNPGQRWPPSNGQDGRLDTRYYPTQYFRLATNKYQYQIPDWAREAQRDPHGNPRPRYNPSNTQDGRLDTRYYPTQYQRRAVDSSTANVNGTTVKPDQIYSWPGSGVGLRIGTGGSDQSGLLVKLLDGYLQQ
jgi:hypothetical protein